MDNKTIVTFIKAAIKQAERHDADDNKHPDTRTTYDGKALVKSLELLFLLIEANDG